MICYPLLSKTKTYFNPKPMPESQKDEFDEQNTDTSDRSLEVPNTGLNPTPGVTYICPDCR